MLDLYSSLSAAKKEMVTHLYDCSHIFHSHTRLNVESEAVWRTGLWMFSPHPRLFVEMAAVIRNQQAKDKCCFTTLVGGGVDWWGRINKLNRNKVKLHRAFLWYSLLYISRDMLLKQTWSVKPLVFCGHTCVSMCVCARVIIECVHPCNFIIVWPKAIYSRLRYQLGIAAARPASGPGKCLRKEKQNHIICPTVSIKLFYYLAKKTQ